MNVYPSIRCALRWGIPFYGIHNWVCYLNPIKGGGLEWVFLNGGKVCDLFPLLKTRGRKSVAGIRIPEEGPAQPEEYRDIFFAAHELDH
jgi:hypothetical protein